MTCDSKDRHVLAAAVAAEADVLLTFSLKDFPPESLAPHNIEALSPDQFLAQLLATAPETVLETLCEELRTFKNPPTSMSEFLSGLSKTVLIFARRAAELLEH